MTRRARECPRAQRPRLALDNRWRERGDRAGGACAGQELSSSCRRSPGYVPAAVARMSAATCGIRLGLHCPDIVTLIRATSFRIVLPTGLSLHAGLGTLRHGRQQPLTLAVRRA